MRRGLFPGSTGRPAFTLIELLVVIAVLLLLMAIGVAFLPTIQYDLAVVNATSQLQGSFLIAKQRAKRDGKPTGLRLQIVNDTVTGNFDCTQLFYIQQPDDFTGGTCTSPGSAQVKFNWQDTDLTGGGIGIIAGQADFAPVQPGDYFEVRRGGGVAQINYVNQVLVVPLPAPAGTPPPSTPPYFNVNTALPAGNVSTTDWRIIRSPRRLQGEEPVVLPTGIDILFLVPVASTKQPYRNIGNQFNIPAQTITDPVGKQAPYYMCCQNIPTRNGSFYEILFSPSGSVVGQGSGAGNIILWVDAQSGKSPPALLVINVRTGLIAVHPVLAQPNPDPYGSTKTGRSSGM